MSIAGFENELATFFQQEQVGTEEDPYGETEPVYEWTAVFEEIPVRWEPQQGEYVREATGERLIKEPRIFVDPALVGVIGPSGYGDDYYGIGPYGGLDPGLYSRGIDENQRIELSGVSGRFVIDDIREHRLDSQIPNHIQLEVSRIED